MSTETQTYNGWKNYETWAVALHIDNDRGTYEMAREQASVVRHFAESGNHPNVPEIWTAEQAARFDLADYLRGLAETLCGIGDESDDYGIAEPSSLAMDMVRAALSEVDWDEIADHILGE
jgi:hypothetical protein